MGAAEKVNPTSVDMEQACTFLDLLGSRFTFQTFDGAGRARHGLTRVLHGTLAEHGDTLARLNAQGAGIFVMVNAGDRKARKASNVRTVRAYFADLDGAPIEPVEACPLQPHIVVQSSRGRWHAYWLTTGAPLEMFKPMQQAIAQRFGSDPKVCDLPRVMRLPGFWHNKRQPFLTTVATVNRTAPYSHVVMAQAFGVSAPCMPIPIRRTLAAVIPQGQRNDELFKLARGLVHSGLEAGAVNQRMQKINAERCKPPLDAVEVDDVCARACSYGSQGFVMLPHALLDSPEWKALPPAALPVVLDAYRRLNPANNGRIALPWCDFKGRHGMERPGTFYKYRARAVDAGVLIEAAEGRLTQQGKQPAFFAVATRFLPASLSTRSDTSACDAKRPLKNINRLEAVEAPDVLHTGTKPR